MIRNLSAAFAAIGVLALAPALARDPGMAQPEPLALEDQFENRQDVGQYRGDVVILVYGDRKATDDCRAMGERLHIAFHPSAKGQPPAEAHRAPVRPLAGLPPGVASPDVRVIPVACVGSVPSPIRTLIRHQVKKGSPDVAVWLDFENEMKRRFGLQSGQPHLVIFDAAGEPRLRRAGVLDGRAMDEVLAAAEQLRREAVADR